MAKNYIIDGDMDFYTELYKSLDEPILDEGSDVCLITNAPLTENFVELECKHKFNYVPLYNDILSHKKTFNKLERRVLKSNEIRCPYCRNIQTTLLPPNSGGGVKLVHGVNYFDEMLEKNAKQYSDVEYISGVCCYTTKSNIKNDDGTISVSIGVCPSTYVKVLPLNGKTYCACHTYYATKDHHKQEKAKLLIKIKEEKKKAKDDAKLEKAKLKQELKEAKLKDKQTIQYSENQIIGGCVEILKSGPKKGTPCGCKIKQGGFCGRHYKASSI
jgi:hypothetical protein